MDTPKLKSVPAEEATKDKSAEFDDREPTKEEILEDIRIGLRDVLAGKEGRPALEVLDEIDRELMEDANAR